MSVLLATALIPVRQKTGNVICLRALLDQGSTTNIITESAAQLLRADKIPTHTSIMGIGNIQTGLIKNKTHISIGSYYDKQFSLNIETAIVPKLTSLPEISTVSTQSWAHIQGLQLADPTYFKAGRIDLLLGAEAVANILMDGIKRDKPTMPIAQQTKLGWVLSGGCADNTTKVHCNLTLHDETNDITEQLRKFWEVEEVEQPPQRILDEIEIETQFQTSVQRCADGKFMVKLPFKSSPNDPNFLGDSFKSAMAQYLNLERKLNKNPATAVAYAECMTDYLTLNHMRVATKNEVGADQNYYLPHHAVIKETSTTTRTRVVFHASAKSSNGMSLNDRLLVGPTIPRDLFSILTNWRIGPIAFSADIAKMYRQIWIHPDDCRFQLLLWRLAPDKPVLIYALTTVAFGTASAPFQAIRTLFQIADEIEKNYPELAYRIRKRLYVDDYLDWAETVEEAQQIRTDMSSKLAEYGFHLRKWISNSPEFMGEVPDDEKEKFIITDPDASSKTLGIVWLPNCDQFTFKSNLEEATLPITKRKILSEVSKLFDPLGWLSPHIVESKILLQELWNEKLSWDDPLPNQIVSKWLRIREEFHYCQRVRINRWLGLSRTVKSCSLHGFADASSKAYAATVYIRIEKENGEVCVNLVAAKTRVAPLNKLSTPRLELSSAVLLAKLLPRIKRALEIKTISSTAWVDSTTALTWIKGDPKRWTVFVTNRVKEIQRDTTVNWRYVPTAQNPADCASRGISMTKLIDHKSWWQGPEFLLNDESEWPVQPNITTDQIPEQRKTKQTFTATIKQQNELLVKYSSLQKLLRITSYCLRWKNRKTNSYMSHVIEPNELNSALEIWIKTVQTETYTDEITCLQTKKPIKLLSNLAKVCPQLDQDQLLRVGGRIQATNLSLNQKHPFILPSSRHLTWLIIDEAHQRTLHSGVQGTLQTTVHSAKILDYRWKKRRQATNQSMCQMYSISSRYDETADGATTGGTYSTNETIYKCRYRLRWIL